MYRDYIHILKKNELFVGMNFEEVAVILACLHPAIREYGKNDCIALEGDNFDSIGIITKGSAAAVKEDENGNRVIMALLKPGDMFGEIAVFTNRPVWPASVFVQEKCTVLFIPSVKLVTSCKSACPWHIMLIQNMLKIISEKALLLNRKVEYLSIKSMRGRISAFLLEQYKRTGATTFTIPMDRNELADFLNVARSSMSRELCKMRDEGIIDFHKAAFKILDAGRLNL